MYIVLLEACCGSPWKCISGAPPFCLKEALDYVSVFNCEWCTVVSWQYLMVLVRYHLIAIWFWSCFIRCLLTVFDSIEKGPLPQQRWPKSICRRENRFWSPSHEGPRQVNSLKVFSCSSIYLLLIFVYLEVVFWGTCFHHMSAIFGAWTFQNRKTASTSAQWNIYVNNTTS